MQKFVLSGKSLTIQAFLVLGISNLLVIHRHAWKGKRVRECQICSLFCLMEQIGIHKHGLDVCSCTHLLRNEYSTTSAWDHFCLKEKDHLELSKCLTWQWHINELHEQLWALNASRLPWARVKHFDPCIHKTHLCFYGGWEVYFKKGIYRSMAENVPIPVLSGTVSNPCPGMSLFQDELRSRCDFQTQTQTKLVCQKCGQMFFSW